MFIGFPVQSRKDWLIEHCVGTDNTLALQNHERPLGLEEGVSSSRIMRWKVIEQIGFLWQGSVATKSSGHVIFPGSSSYRCSWEYSFRLLWQVRFGGVKCWFFLLLPSSPNCAVDLILILLYFLKTSKHSAAAKTITSPINRAWKSFSSFPRSYYKLIKSFISRLI